jgi:hypothetical protein
MQKPTLLSQNFKINPRFVFKPSLVLRGLIRRSFSFLWGTLASIYTSQNYNVPNIKALAESGLSMAKHIEKTYRKPSKHETQRCRFRLMDSSPYQVRHPSYSIDPLILNNVKFNALIKHCRNLNLSLPAISIIVEVVIAGG